MAESNGHLCPECGAPRGTDNTPSCGCTQRASDALRDARTAEAAAAEDFDPLRIRPYVELDEETAPVPKVPAPDVTMPLRVPAPPTVPSRTDLNLFEVEADSSAPVRTTDGPPRRTRRRTVLLATSGAVVTVAAAAAFAGGVFTYESPVRDEAARGDVRPAVPDATTTAASASPSTAAASVRPSSAPQSATASASPSASPSPSRSSASPSPSLSAEPSATPTASAATDSAAGSDATREVAPQVLRRGSEGPEVVELELRLTQIGLYARKASGHYNEGVEDAVSAYQWQRGLQVAEHGVYDLVTRQRLESETREP
ncbi:peptidoglycan-binding domain-containing protein [Streptomyces doebereineriae]|uniref:Peptidoglycan-binding domain-containing protein n=1 Tax=Streptomyces doebereineriae TaxID=3075528 RepID=A0ABU2VMM0_9ACTN|nr:peptidoglycan-binding domain-containing protein [Streptomyces sp. DSM 41640]MDT0486851.1 peptidoglycan-binding domain-containing protein [Streptomyces sp. DSM 41640]